MSTGDEQKSRLPAMGSSYMAALIMLGAVVLYFAIGTLTASGGAPVAEEGVDPARDRFRVLIDTVSTTPRANDIRLSTRRNPGPSGPFTR